MMFISGCNSLRALESVLWVERLSLRRAKGPEPRLLRPRQSTREAGHAPHEHTQRDDGGGVGAGRKASGEQKRRWGWRGVQRTLTDDLLEESDPDGGPASSEPPNHPAFPPCTCANMLFRYSTDGLSKRNTNMGGDGAGQQQPSVEPLRIQNWPTLLDGFDGVSRRGRAAPQPHAAEEGGWPLLHCLPRGTRASCGVRSRSWAELLGDSG